VVILTIVAVESPPNPGLILASSSPRRRELLARFELSFEILPANIDESTYDDERAEHYVVRMAEEKALAVAQRFPEQIVLAADTSVVLDRAILGKPVDQGEAKIMLEALSDRSHQVMSAVAVVVPEISKSQSIDSVASRLSVTRVVFAPLSPAWIRRYIASGDPMDKAGAYGIQSAAGLKVQRIEGSYSGVVGLPLFETGQLLTDAGLFKCG